MMEQPALQFSEKDGLHDRLFGDVSRDLMDAFKKFHGANPKIYELFKKFAYEAKRAGRKRFSHWAIAQRIRWYTTVETVGDDFKISNDYLTIYARLLVWNHPEDFDGFFSLKACKPDRKVRDAA